MQVVAFFNNKGGVGRTTLVYHLAWMFAEMGIGIVAADLDPQSNLTSMFLDEERLEQLWPKGRHELTIRGVVDPIIRGLGDIQTPHLEMVDAHLGLLVGDLGLSGFEDKLSDAWPKCHNRDESAFRTTTALYRAVLNAAEQIDADLVLADVGPNLGAINRSALIASDHVVVPLAPDLFSLQGLRNLGPQLSEWRSTWQDLKGKNPDAELPMPKGNMKPAGYVVIQHAVRADRPVKAYARWIDRIPAEYREALGDEPQCLASLKHYRSLMPMAQEARKPMFRLKPADGAIGAHVQAVRDCFLEFEALAVQILDATGGGSRLPSA